MAGSLFDTMELGQLKLKNRILMTPMTRGRADARGAPQDIVAAYYRQLAEAWLIITEGVAVTPLGHGWSGAPGLYTDHHQAGWARVATAIMAQAGMSSGSFGTWEPRSFPITSPVLNLSGPPPWP